MDYKYGTHKRTLFQNISNAYVQKILDLKLLQQPLSYQKFDIQKIQGKWA